jgi:hypothetical protein
MMIATSLLLRILGGLSTWVLYSQWLKLAAQQQQQQHQHKHKQQHKQQQQHKHKHKQPSLQQRIQAILSQTRDDGNITQLLALAAHLPTNTDDLEYYQTPVWESKQRFIPDTSNNNNNNSTTTTTDRIQQDATTILSKKIGTHMILVLENTPPTSKVSLWASCKVPKESLETLVKSTIPHTKTEPFWIRVWMQAIDDTVPAELLHSLLSGTYILRFRDYNHDHYNDHDDNHNDDATNHIHNDHKHKNKNIHHPYENKRIFSSLRPNSRRPTKFMVHGHCCTLTDHYLRWGIIPFQVEWRGHIVPPNVILWTGHSRSRGIGRHVDLRISLLQQDPWYIRVTRQTKTINDRKETDPTVIVLERKGIGRLVFSKES